MEKERTVDGNLRFLISSPIKAEPVDEDMFAQPIPLSSVMADATKSRTASTTNSHNSRIHSGETYSKDRIPMLLDTGRYDSYRPENNRSFREDSYRPQDRQQVGPLIQTNNSSRRLSHHLHRSSKKRRRSRSPARSPVRPPVRSSVEPQSFSRPHNNLMYHCHHVGCPRNKGKGFGTEGARDSHVAAMHAKRALQESSSKKHFCIVSGCKKTASEGFSGFSTIEARDSHVSSHKLEQKPLSSKPAVAKGKPLGSTKQLSRKRAWSPSPPKVYFCTQTSCKRAAPGNDFQGFMTIQARDAHIAACKTTSIPALSKEVELQRLVTQLGSELGKAQTLYQKVKTACDELVKESSEASHHISSSRTIAVQGSSLHIPVGPRNSLPPEQRYTLPVNLKHTPPTGPRFGTSSPSSHSRHRDSPAPMSRSEPASKLDEGDLHPARRQRLDNWEGGDEEPNFEGKTGPLRITGPNAMLGPQKSMAPMTGSVNGASKINAKDLGFMCKQSTGSIMENVGQSFSPKALDVTSATSNPVGNDCTCSLSSNHSRAECPVVCKQSACFRDFSVNRKSSASFDSMHKAMLCNSKCAICGEDGPYMNSRTGHLGVYCPRKSCVCGQKHLLQSCMKVCGACAKVGCRSHCQNCGMAHHIEECFLMKTQPENQNKDQSSTSQVEINLQPGADLLKSRSVIQNISTQTPYEDHIMEDVRPNEGEFRREVNISKTPDMLGMANPMQSTSSHSTDERPASRTPEKLFESKLTPKAIQSISNNDENPQLNQNMLVASCFGDSDVMSVDNSNAQSVISGVDNPTKDSKKGNDQLGTVQQLPAINMSTGNSFSDINMQSSDVEPGSVDADNFLKSLEDLLEQPKIPRSPSQRETNSSSTSMSSISGYSEL